MTDELRNRISEFPEISEYGGRGGGVHFVAALGWGTLAGMIGLAAMLAHLEWPGVNLPELVFGLFLYVALVAVFNFAGMVLIGLPTTFVLRALKLEHATLYAILGAISGFLALAFLFDVLWMDDLTRLALPGSGALAGFASAWRWGRWRNRASTEARAALHSEPHERPANPVHDMIH